MEMKKDKIIKIKPKTYRCECGGDCEYKIEIYDFGTGNFEINGTYLSKKTIKKIFNETKTRR